MTDLDYENRASFLMPAYGRSYKTEQAAVTDWQNGKDFRLADTGQYCSIRDIELLRKEYKTLYLICSVNDWGVRIV